MAAAGITFALCVGIIIGGYWVVIVRQEAVAARTLRKRLTTASERPRKTEITKTAPPLSAVRIIDSLLVRSGLLIRPLQLLITLSGLTVTVGTILLASTLIAVLTFLAVQVLVSSAWLAAVLAIIAAQCPRWFVRLIARHRLQQLEEQFPEAIDLIAVSLRAGHAFATALLIVAEEMAQPLAKEFRQVYDEQNYGKPLPDVLKEMTERVPLLDVRIFVTAVLTQREVGGNLAEVLDKLSGVIRERFKVKRQVRVVSAHGRITGWVLAVLPPAVAMILYSIAPDHVMTLVRDPIGLQITAAAITLQIIGTLAIRRIVRVEF